MSPPNADAATDPSVATGDAVDSSGDGLRVRGVIETALYCPDLAAAERFYTEVLSFQVFARDEGRHLFFRCGDGMLLLFNPRHTGNTVTKVGDAKVPLHGHDGAGHVAFRADVGEIERWKRRLAEHGVAIESEITWPEGGISIFFRDPAGNVLEFTTPITWGLER